VGFLGFQAMSMNRSIFAIVCAHFSILLMSALPTAAEQPAAGGA